jgi:signal transduction histidine kinase
VGATVVTVCCAVLPWAVTFGPVTGGSAGILAAVVVTAAMASVYLLASRRHGPAGRLSQALLIQALSVFLVAAGNLVRLAHSLGARVPMVPRVGEISEFAIWILGFLALIRIPLLPIARENRWRVATDIAISYIGMALILFVIWMLPGIRDALPESRRRIMFFNIMEAGNLFVLNLILVRGSPPGIRKAVGWLAAAIVADTFYLVAFQYATGQRIDDARFLDSLFYIDIFIYFVAGVHFMLGETESVDERARTALVRIINPLPFCAVLGVGALLIMSAVQHAGLSVTVLATGEVLMAALLVVRVVASTIESLRLVQEKIEIERRSQAQRIDIMRRLSGGVSHVMNNLMTVVLGNAQLLRVNTQPDSPDLENIDAINKAALDAARLAARLGLASGNRIHGDAPRPLSEVVLSQRDAVTRLVGQKRDVLWDIPEREGTALVAPTDAETVIGELVANAGEATYHAGKITIRIRDVVLPEGFAGCPASGPHSVLEVSDTGRGISSDDLPRVVEPFFTNRPFHEGRGLGLSVVQGIASRYGGGLRIETEPGAGSVVRVYFPKLAI